MRLFTVAFLLLIPSATIGRTGVSVQKGERSHPGIAAANHSVLLPATPETMPERKDVDTARPQPLASEARLHDRRSQSAPAPTRDIVSLCSYERTADQAARPPPFQA
ncbi:MAG TPA: hypothetical protein VEB19_03255 [Gemmatimonadaceae bacterium]|nr:hypothetical protein [Gemmatimonadaceae bacterium]